MAAFCRFGFGFTRLRALLVDDSGSDFILAALVATLVFEILFSAFRIRLSRPGLAPRGMMVSSKKRGLMPVSVWKKRSPEVPRDM